MASSVVCSIVVCLCVSASASNYQRTVVAIARPTEYGEYIFLQGGNSIGAPIPIINNMTTNNKHSVYSQTSKGDNFLNWGGREPNQGSFIHEGQTTLAEGTPMIWTTNDQRRDANVEDDGHGYSELNYLGEHLWLADFYMDCDNTDNGWFDFKGYMVDLRPGRSGEGWERHFIHQSTCVVDGEETDTQRNEQNHHGRCGYFNFVMWSSDMCLMNKLSHHVMALRDEWVEDNTVLTS